MRLHRSALLGQIVHGFSTRSGGVSSGRYESLNLGRRWGDEPAHVEQNRRLLALEAGFDEARLHTATQVHGATCVLVDGHDPATSAATEADALVATTPGAAVGVFTADCVPILYSDGAGRVAAAHAGWRGTVAGIAAVTLEALRSVGAARGEVRVAIGPSIGPCCFEVGEEVAAVFDRLAIEGVVRRSEGRKPHVDLWLANRALLERAGLGRDQIDATPACTVCHPERYFSFRRDGGSIGQMLSFIVAGG